MMDSMLLLRSSLTLDELAMEIRRVLNIPHQNRSNLEQERYSDNRGGRYYLFEAFGLELELVQNHGDASIPGCSDWQYYILIDNQDGVHVEDFGPLSQLLCDTLRQSGLHAKAAAMRT